MRKSFLLAVAILAFAGSAFAQNSASTTGNASARVITPISVGQDAALSFGGFFAGAGGNVIITSNTTSGSAGTRTGSCVAYTGTATWSAPGNASAQVAHQAEFSVEGEVGFSYHLACTGPFTVTSGANSMTYALANPTSNGAAVVGTAASGNSSIGSDTGGDTDDIFFGATLTVASGQATGIYAGTYSVAVNYN